MAEQMAFYFDAAACTACKACQATCKDKNSLPIGVRWRRVYRYEGGSWTPHPVDPSVKAPVGIFAYSVSISCMHCENPLCVENCPTGAIFKREDGVVLINGEECIGCRFCEWSCPYGAPQFDDERQVMTKCDFCQDLLAKGEDPACVAACPTRALGFGPLEELRAQFGNIDAIEPLPVADYTQPSIVITPHKNAQISGYGTGYVANLPEEV